MKLTKYDYRVLMIKDLFQIVEFIFQFIFIKIVIIEKYCDNGKKYYDDEKML